MTVAASLDVNASALTLALAAPAAGELLHTPPLPVPPLPLLPIVGDPTSGTVGGIIPGSQGVTDVIDDALGSSPDAPLPDDAVTSLLGTLNPGGTGAAGTGASTGGSSPSGSLGATNASGANGTDLRAPVAKFKVVSRLAAVAKTGKLVVRVTCDEAGVVAFTSAMRPGKGMRRKGRTLMSRKLVKLKTEVLGFRTPGALRVKLTLSRAARRALKNARDARVAFLAATVDLARNQGRVAVKRTLHRASKVAQLQSRRGRARHRAVVLP